MHFLIACLVSLLFTLPSFAATIASTPLISGNLSDADKFPISRSGSGVAYTGNVTKLKDVIRPNTVVVGVDSDALTLADANSDVDNIGKTIVLNTPVTLAADLTLATDRAWRFEKGAVITTTGYTLNANGASVDIGNYQVFTGTGAVTGLKESRPDYFGNNTTPGTTDMYSAIRAAIDSLSHGGLLTLQNTKYRFNTQITLGKKLRIQGTIGTEDHESVYGATLVKGFNGTGIIVDQSSTVIDGIILDGIVGNTGDGIHIYANSDQLTNFAAINQGGIGIRIGHATETKNCNHWQLNNVTARNNGSHGILIDQYDAGSGPDANAGLANGVWCSQNTGDGIQIAKAVVNTLIGISNESNTGYGIHFASGAKNNTLVNPHSEVNTAGNSIMDSGSLGNVIHGSPNFVTTDNGSNLIMQGAGSSFADAWWLNKVLRIGAGTARNNTTGTVAGVGLESATPGVWMYDTGGAADTHLTEVFSNAGAFTVRFTSDNGLTTNDVFKINRSGTNVGVIVLKVLGTYADNTAALAAGLTAGSLYRITGTGTLAIVY